MNLEDKVDNYLRLYIQKDIPITREQADEINEYKCELRNRINKAIEYIEETTKRNDELNCTKLLAVNQVEQLLEILKGKSE